MLPVKHIVGSHYRVGVCSVHRGIKARKIHFIECSLIDYSVHPQSVRLLTVHRKMLHTCSHVRLLYPFDKRNRHLRDKIRILTHVLKISPAKRRPLDVNSRREYDILAPAPRLLAENLTALFSTLRIPGGCYGTVRRKICNHILLVINTLPLVINKLLTDTHRSVRHMKLRYSKPRHSRRPEKTRSVYHPYFFIKC